MPISQPIMGLAERYREMFALLVNRTRSVEFEHIRIVLFQGRILLFFPHQAITDDKNLNFRAHEAPERIFGGADNRFSPNVEARIDEDGASGEFLKPRK